MNGNITTAPLGGNRNIKTKPLFQYDYGQVLKIVGVTLPAAYEVHFSNQLHGVATTQIGNADGVIIPDIYLTTGEPVYAWIYLHTGNSDGETEYTITIPVVRRASISDAEPTPVQQDVITQAIAALNTAVEQTAQDVQDATEAKEDAEEAAGNAYESAVAAAQSAANAGTYAGQAQSAQAASELAQQKAEEAQTGAQTAKWAAESAQTAAEAAQAGAVAARTGAETAQAWAVAARSGAEAAQHAAEAARDEITGMSATANTLPAGSQATASYSNGLLTIGVPKGEKGNTGDTGATPDFTIGTVQTLPAGSEATATITGTPEDPVLNLGIPKGDPGEVTQAEFDALAGDVSDMQDTLEHKADIDGYYSDMTVGAAEQVVSSTMVEDNAPYKLRTSGGSTDIGNRAYVDKIVGGTVAWNQQVRDAASENVTEYADVVTVTDAVEDDAAVSVMVEPVQDLHGYDSPWPAGGGVNKLKLNVDAFPATNTWLEYNDTTEKITIKQGNNIAPAPLQILQTIPTGTDITVSIYIESGEYTTGTIAVGGYNNSSDSKSWQGTTDLPRGTNLAGQKFVIPYTTTATLDTFEVFVYASPTITTPIVFRAQIELGTNNNPTWTPYSNICPISGWDEINVTRTGVNIWDEEWDMGYVNIADGTYNSYPKYVRSKRKFRIKGGETYRLACARTGTLGNFGITFYNASGDFIKGDTATANTTVTTPTDAAQMAFFVPSSWYTGDYTNDISINYPATDTEYHAYNGSTYTIEMPTEAGTVYGGKLTVNKDGTGSLVVNRANITAPTVSVALHESTGLYYALWSINQALGISTSSAHPLLSNITYGNAQIVKLGNAYIAARSTMVYVMHDQTLTTKAAVEQFFVDNNVQFVYELETPITYTLTASQVQTLLGTNHVWSDAGQVALTYTGTDEHLVLTTGRKYLTRINGTDSMVLGAGQEVTAAKGTDNVFDLTQMFGSAVADYVYGQGASFFRKWFPNTRYPYSAGELKHVEGLQSHDMVGFNLWDEELESGNIDTVTGENRNNANTTRSKNYIPVIPLTNYYMLLPWAHIFFYNANKEYIAFTGNGVAEDGAIHGKVIAAPANAHYMRFRNSGTYGTTYKHDICINLAHNNSRNGEYEPYTHRSYPLDSTLTLRGIPKVGTNGVYWDGDEYGYDGAVKRRYGVMHVTAEMVTSVSSAYTNVTYALMNCANDGEKTLTKVGISSLHGEAVRIFPFDTNAAIGKLVFNAVATQWWVGFPAGTTLEQAREALDGMDILYVLATPTAETATPYQQIQYVDDWGTEEFVSGTITPVGHESRYPQNLRDKLQHLPALASSNGSYIITQTDGQMVLSPFPAPPTTAGNYLLKATVSGGNATYSWVAQ